MKRRFIGNTDLAVSEVGLGGNNFGTRCDLKQSRRIIETALEAGITFFDTADIYGDGRSEQYLGKALLCERQNVVLATKCGRKRGGEHPRLTCRYIKNSCETSLSRLNTTWIDLYQIHRWDDRSDQDEVMQALLDLQSEGKIRTFGCSDYSAEQLAMKYPSGQGYSSVQTEYNLFVRQNAAAIRQVCCAKGISIIPYYPIAAGFLSQASLDGLDQQQNSRRNESKFKNRYQGQTNHQVSRELKLMSLKLGLPPSSIALAWLLKDNLIASIPMGVTSEIQLKENLRFAEVPPIHLTPL